jgi:hypothetical protein
MLSFVQAQTRGTSNDYGMKQVRFYPNPATTFIQFDFSENTDLAGASLKIYNFIGKKVYESDQLKLRTTVNLNDYFRGVYIFQLLDRHGRVIESSKFQVQK